MLFLFTGHASVQELVHNFFEKRIDDFAMGGTTNEGLWLKDNPSKRLFLIYQATEGFGQIEVIDQAIVII